MKRVNGIIVEATREELKDMWFTSEWNRIGSFESFMRFTEDRGCTITDKEGKSCDSQIIDSARIVQSETSEQKMTATVDQSEMENEAASDIVEKVHVQDSVTSVQTQTNVAIQTSTAVSQKKSNSSVKKSSTSTVSTAKPEMSSDETSKNTVLPSKPKFIPETNKGGK